MKFLRFCLQRGLDVYTSSVLSVVMIVRIPEPCDRFSDRAHLFLSKHTRLLSPPSRRCVSGQVFGGIIPSPDRHSTLVVSGYGACRVGQIRSNITVVSDIVIGSGYRNRQAIDSAARGNLADCAV